MKDNAGKVLFLLRNLNVGGSERKTVRVVNQLRRQGREVELAYLRMPDILLPQIDSGVPVTFLGEPGRLSPRVLWRLIRLVRQRRIGTIVTINPYPLLYAVPTSWSRALADVRAVSSVNTSDFMARPGFDHMKIYGPLMRRVGAIVFGSHRQRGDWIARYRLADTHSTVIYNGVDTRHFQPGAMTSEAVAIREQLGIGQDEFVFTCVGQLRPEKAHVNQIEALSQLERDHGLRPRLLIVGEGLERQRIEERTAGLGVAGRVHMIGEVAEVRPYLSAANAFLLSSIAVETFSNAALEAAAMGLPVVLSDVCGATEMFPEDRGGFVYARNDIDELVASLAMIQVPGKALGEGAEARKIVVEGFSIRQMVDAWDRLLWSPTATVDVRGRGQAG